MERIHTALDAIEPYITGATICVVVVLLILGRSGLLTPAAKRQDRLPILIDERWIVDQGTCEVIETVKGTAK